MKRTMLAAIAAALAFGATSADAAILLYQLQGANASKYSATFTLDTSLTPSIILPTSVRYNGVPITYTPPGGKTATASFSNTGPTFQTLNNQGGFYLGYLGGNPIGFSVFGPQLFTGGTTSPQFLTGTFGLSDIPRNRTTDPLQVDYTLIVTDVSAVPEPATWAMMLAGFGALGFTTRKRRARSSATFARRQLA